MLVRNRTPYNHIMPIRSGVMPIIQVLFINLIPKQFFHKSLHTPYCIPASTAR